MVKSAKKQGRKRKFRGKSLVACTPAHKQPESTVLSQPHRLGNRDQRCATIFGQFCLKNGLPKEFYIAGESYLVAVLKWRSAKGIPTPFQNETSRTGLGVDPEKARLWARRMIEMEKAMYASGLLCLLAVKQLILDGNPLGMEQDHHAREGLTALAIYLNLWKPSEDTTGVG